MKKRSIVVFYASLFLLFAIQAKAQLKLTIAVDPGSNLLYKQEIYVRGWLKNISDKAVKITKPTPYAMWRTDKDHWVLIKNGQIERPFKFVERPDRKFKKTDLLTLAPNDSVIVSLYKWSLDVEGEYAIKLQYEQIKANIEPVYVDAGLLKDRLDFKTESNTINFKIEKPKSIAKSELIDYQKLLFSTTYYDGNPNEIYTNINAVNRLKLNNADNYKLFTECKNVQMLEVSGFDMDSIPELFASWNLQYLEFFTRNRKKINYVPENFCKEGNLRHLHLCWGPNDSLPDFIFKQPKLEYLRIFATQINRIDDRFGNLTNLKFLEMDNIKNTPALPAVLSKLVNLEHLSVVQVEGLIDISAIEQLPKLKMLRIFADGINRENEVLKRMKAKNKELMIFTKYGMVM